MMTANTEPPMPTWSPTFTAAWDETTSGLLPCECEGGWLPLPDGGYVRCYRCGLEEDE